MLLSEKVPAFCFMTPCCKATWRFQAADGYAFFGVQVPVFLEDAEVSEPNRDN